MNLTTPALLAFACIVPGPAVAQRPPRLTWDAFAAHADSRCAIRMVLPDGTHIEGRPILFREDALELKVSRTSNPKAHPKGLATVPRDAVSAVEIRSPRKKGRLIGALVPFGAGAAIVAGATARSVEAPIYELLAVGGLTMGLGTPAGYFAGRAVDRRFQQFVIVRGEGPDRRP